MLIFFYSQESKFLNACWDGVPFFMRAGKGLSEKNGTKPELYKFGSNGPVAACEMFAE